MLSGDQEFVLSYPQFARISQEQWDLMIAIVEMYLKKKHKRARLEYNNAGTDATWTL